MPIHGDNTRFALKITDVNFWRTFTLAHYGPNGNKFGTVYCRIYTPGKHGTTYGVAMNANTKFEKKTMWFCSF